MLPPKPIFVRISLGLDALPQDVESLRECFGFLKRTYAKVNDPPTSCLIWVVGDVLADEVWPDHSLVIDVLLRANRPRLLIRQDKPSADRHRTLERATRVLGKRLVLLNRELRLP